MSESANNQQYTVVARRYRPQTFSDLVGQGHIAQALGNAIAQNRVGHAYLFTGARGVGKTSSARIFAKCLNCERGPAAEPCNECDICESVSTGEDVDVLEIDGASNRGIDEIRQLRSNAGVRPSRSRFKIYIIDEVHMLTSQAFNALLKTLEEPPEHVKFIFCTTDPQKIPITVLSRCQRFDFSPVQANEITKRLREIAENEGVQADEKALALLARRAAGSMRDSQSLLEQLFSFCGDSISVDEVHQLLGTTDTGRIAGLADAMAEHDSAAAMKLISSAVADGVDAGQFASQLLGYFRDMMALKVGCGLETMLSCDEEDLEKLGKLAEHFGLETILNIVQIFDATVMRMQSSVHAQTLLEVAAIRVCNLESLDSLADLVDAITDGKAIAVNADGAETSKKKLAVEPSVALQQTNGEATAVHAQVTGPTSRDEPTGRDDELSVGQGQAVPKQNMPVDSAMVSPAVESTKSEVGDADSASGATSTVASVQSESAVPAAPVKPPKASFDSASSNSSSFDLGRLKDYWKKAAAEINDMTADIIGCYQKLEMTDQNSLVVTMPDAYNRDLCNRPERRQKIESAFEKVSGKKLRIDFTASATRSVEAPKQPKLTRRQQIQRLQELPIVKKTLEIFDADIVDYREPLPKN